eukprot:5897033-Prymnesium_polylepis.1
MTSLHPHSIQPCADDSKKKRKSCSVCSKKGIAFESTVDSEWTLCRSCYDDKVKNQVRRSLDPMRAGANASNLPPLRDSQNIDLRCPRVIPAQSAEGGDATDSSAPARPKEKFMLTRSG